MNRNFFLVHKGQVGYEEAKYSNMLNQSCIMNKPLKIEIGQIKNHPNSGIPCFQKSDGRNLLLGKNIRKVVNFGPAVLVKHYYTNDAFFAVLDGKNQLHLYGKLDGDNYFNNIPKLPRRKKKSFKNLLNMILNEELQKAA